MMRNMDKEKVSIRVMVLIGSSIKDHGNMTMKKERELCLGLLVDNIQETSKKARNTEKE